MEVAQVGHHPELEEKLFCGACQARSQPVAYNYTDITEGIEAGTYRISGQCIHCGGQLPPPAAPVPSVVFPEPAPEPPQPQRRPRVVREEP